MAAIVRSGARRLAGSALLQRAPAAGAILQPKPAADGLIQRTQASGPFPARFMSSTKQQARRAPPESLCEAPDEIQVKKEQLYDMISVTENSVHTDSRNRRLLMSLSAQIKPRPDDSKWLLVRASKRRSDVIRPAGTIAGLCLGLASIFVMESLEELSQSCIKERQELEAAKSSMKEQEMEAAKEKEVSLV